MTPGAPAHRAPLPPAGLGRERRRPCRRRLRGRQGTYVRQLYMTAQRRRMTRDNTAVLLIDYQIGLLTDVRDVRVAKLTNNVVSLANSAVELGLPIVAITTACDALGPAMSELKYVLGRAQIMDRSTVNPWDYPPFVAAVTVTRRTHLIMAGLGFEVGVTLLAISARAHGYQPAVAIDACGTFTTKDRQSGIERLTALDVEVCDYAVLFSEITAGEKADK